MENKETMSETSLKKDVLTFNEVAIYTGFSKSYLYKLTSTRRIPHYCPTGKVLFFNRIEVENWLQGNRIATTNEIESKAQSYCMGRRAGK